MPFDERISHCARRGHEIIDSDREARSKEEKYTYSRISKGRYACETGKSPGDMGYLIHVTDDGIGCSCQDMTFHCKGNEICKHIIRFLALGRVPENLAPDDITGFLRGMGWGGLELAPPAAPNVQLDPPMDSLGVNDPLPETQAICVCSHCGTDIIGTTNEDAVTKLLAHEKICPKNPVNAPAKEPEPPAKITATCPHCQMQAVRDTQEKADAWLKTHLKTCKDNPNKEPPKSTELLAAQCQYCGKEIKRKRPNDLKAAIETHEAKCPKRPKTDTAIVPKPDAAPSTDVMPSDSEFTRAAVGRYLENQGGMYRVGNKEIPDSAAVQNYAIAEGVSTELIRIEQTPDYTLAVVRAHIGNRYVDASVLTRKDAMISKFYVDLAEKHPDWVIGWANGVPEFDLNKKVAIGDKMKLMGLYIAGAIADKWIFAPRDNETKATRRSQVKALGSDWREDSEVESEREEVETVNRGI